MKTFNQIISKCKEQRGVTAVVVAIAIVMLMGFVALAVDVGFVAATKNELQNVADSAALAGTELLGNIYTGKTQAQMDVYNCSTAGDCALIIAQAQDVVGSGKNIAGGEDIVIDSGDVIIGKWDGTSLTPSNGYPSGPVPDAVKVTARRDSTAGGNGPISTFFAKIFNINTVDVKADATADLSGLSKIAPGGLPIPVGVSIDMFNGQFCDEPLIFHPTTTSCAGWHQYEMESNDPKFKNYPYLLNSLKGHPPAFTTPETNAGDIFNFNGGTNMAGYKVLNELFEDHKGDNDNFIDRDTDPNTWTTTLVVFDGPCYSNPVQSFEILGFAVIKIYGICCTDTVGETMNGYVCLAKEPQIVGNLVCDYVEPQRGGGGEYGIIGAIAGLVE